VQEKQVKEIRFQVYSLFKSSTNASKAPRNNITGSALAEKDGSSLFHMFGGLS
jgi:hypothetical protein